MPGTSLNSYKLYSISKVRHKALNSEYDETLSGPMSYLCGSGETESQSLSVRASVCPSLRAEYPAGSCVLDMPKDCSDLGRTVQVRNLYLCEWGVPTSHHVKPG